MPKYEIICCTTTYHYCIVDAPSREAADRWYDWSDGSAFRASRDNNWEYVETNEVDYPADLKVDEDGSEIKED